MRYIHEFYARIMVVELEDSIRIKFAKTRITPREKRGYRPRDPYSH